MSILIYRTKTCYIIPKHYKQNETNNIEKYNFNPYFSFYIIRFLFNRDSMIETWNDNEWEIDEETEEALENKYWDEEKQQYKDGYWDAEEWAHFKLPIPEDMIEWKYLKSN